MKTSRKLVNHLFQIHVYFSGQLEDKFLHDAHAQSLALSCHYNANGHKHGNARQEKNTSKHGDSNEYRNNGRTNTYSFPPKIVWQSTFYNVPIVILHKGGTARQGTTGCAIQGIGK